VYEGSGSDADVMRASLADPARFETLFERHFTAIFRYVGRRLGRQAAEDVAAEVFLRAFELRGRYDGGHADARPWLFGIAANLVRHSWRDEQRRLRALARRPATPAAVPDDAEGRLDSRAQAPRLAQALAELRADEREVLLLVAWAELTYDEVARALDIPLGTVRSRLHRARAHMSARIGAGEGGAADADDGLPGVCAKRAGPAERAECDGPADLAESRSRALRVAADHHAMAQAPLAMGAAKEDTPWTTSI